MICWRFTVTSDFGIFFHRDIFGFLQNAAAGESLASVSSQARCPVPGQSNDITVASLLDSRLYGRSISPCQDPSLRLCPTGQVYKLKLLFVFKNCLKLWRGIFSGVGVPERRKFGFREPRRPCSTSHPNCWLLSRAYIHFRLSPLIPPVHQATRASRRSLQGLLLKSWSRRPSTLLRNYRSICLPFHVGPVLNSCKQRVSLTSLSVFPRYLDDICWAEPARVLVCLNDSSHGYATHRRSSLFVDHSSIIYFETVTPSVNISFGFRIICYRIINIFIYLLLINLLIVD